MDIQKEREAFDQYFKEKYQEFHNEVFDENGDDRAIIGYSFAWSAWQAAKAQAVPKWISVKNAMPKAGSWFVAYDDFNGFVETGKADGHEDPNNVFFSHWLPLPNVPQEPKG